MLKIGYLWIVVLLPDKYSNSVPNISANYGNFISICPILKILMMSFIYSRSMINSLVAISVSLIFGLIPNVVTIKLPSIGTDSQGKQCRPRSDYP